VRLREQAYTLPPLTFPMPTLQVAIEPQTKADLDKMGSALQRMLEEEPSAHVERSETGEQILVAMGDAHVAVLGERLKRKFGAAIVTKTPKVPYKETIRGKTQRHGRYKKQTGGHGMFGDVWIEIEPNPGGGVEFAEHVVGGTVPKNFFPGVEKGVRESAAEGVLAGYPLSDFKATLYDGSFHAVDSNELSFKIAASMALKAGVLECKPALMEPIMTVEIRIPEATWATSTATSTAAAAASWAWTPRTGCRSSPPACPRPSSSPTPRSCARSPAAAAPSPPRWTATRTSRSTSPRR
jgi:elongation factor G